jgi:L,D-peptidoglycan transpeptidase YkuD (ErfK/YbiS/YcfS/YnhG family)
MIEVFKNGTLKFNNKYYNCAIGANGIKQNKKEGDSSTPSGVFSFGSIFYRKDRIPFINSSIKSIPIEKNMFWSDNPKSKYYNKLINFNDKTCEILYKEDKTYDIFLVVNYNTKPILKHKGSAIFMHIAKGNYEPTKGCIALKKNCLLNILKYLSPKDKIKINLS